MDDQDQLTIKEIVSGFADASLRKSRDILFELLVNKSAESLDEFENESLGDIFTICVEQLCSTNKEAISLTNLCLSLICNLTVTEEYSQIFLDLYTIKDSSGLTSLKSDFVGSLESFLKYDSQLFEEGDGQGISDLISTGNSEGALNGGSIVGDYDWVKKDPWQHMSSILCNLTRVEDGRRILLKQSSKYMEMLIRQIRSRNPIRRRGAVASLRTCLFDNEIHWWIIHEVRVLPYIMLPIIVATPFTDMEKDGMDPLLWLNAENPAKKWESEMDILIMLLECVILLCQKRGIREELRKRKVYPMCRNLDYLQEDEGVSNLILEIVNFLMRDEDPNAPLEVENGPMYKNPSVAEIVETSADIIKSSSVVQTEKAAEPSNISSDYLDLVD